MKRISIVGIGAIALIATVPFVGNIPGLGKIWDSGSAIAQNAAKGQVQLRLEAEKQIITQDQQGKQVKQWQPLQGKVTVKPGDVLRYTISGENTSDRPVKNLTLNQPIPQGMVYVLKSAKVDVNKNSKITYSIDGGRSFVENPTVKVTLPNGNVENQPAPASAYTHIRLHLPVVDGKTTVQANYQVQVR
ncbi:hypothetical protein [Nodularia sphaerocarpa]|uniref:hypothetical protein n=1 Tax=Nodularia sphaerocarpa TaxID=137816 RepID=UPI001EFAA75B|nr:hypothetical protein [Nodularia sphaerocarpa]MDB9376134.1 hypothetical protein [Nodularia sphaerocarpa CS-585]MDB9376860.1 hypothetical protein [Nodularia sphaerocarpa CS-585A2]ULP73426.1 hypothetical protein BDGGKGIB_03080 [Nodularia sphaerocarpa UHCC 0038]